MNILIGVGALFALLYIASAFVSIRRKTPGFSGVSGLLLLVAAGTLVAAVVFFAAGATIPLVISGVLLVASLVLLAMERSALGQAAYGTAGAFVAIFIAAAIFAVPFINGAFANAAAANAQDDLSTQVAEARRLTVNRSNVPVQSDEADLLPVAQFEPEASATRVPLEPTVTPTPFTFELPTPVPPICNGTVNANVNFREQPDLTADLINVIPEGTVINIFEEVQNDSGTWYRTTFEDRFDGSNRTGWVSATVVSQQSDCE